MSTYGSTGLAVWYKPHMQNKKMNKKPIIIIVISLILVSVVSCFLMAKYPVFNTKESNIILGIMLSLNTLLTIGIMTKIIYQYSGNNMKKHKTAICIVTALMIPSFLLIYFLLPKYMVSGIILFVMYFLLTIVLGAIAISDGEKGWMIFAVIILFFCVFVGVLFGVKNTDMSLEDNYISQSAITLKNEITKSAQISAEKIGEFNQGNNANNFSDKVGLITKTPKTSKNDTGISSQKDNEFIKHVPLGLMHPIEPSWIYPPLSTSNTNKTISNIQNKEESDNDVYELDEDSEWN